MHVKSALLSIGLLGVIYNSTHAMTPFLTLAGDASIVASCFSIAMGKTSISDNWQILKSLSPTQFVMIHKDASFIRPYVPLLLPIGFVVSAGMRFNMLMQSPVRGTLKAGISIPLNLALIFGTYALRIWLAPETADAVGKIGDLVDNFMKRR